MANTVVQSGVPTWRRRVHHHVFAPHLSQRANAWAWVVMLAMLANLSVTVLESVPELFDAVHRWEPVVSWVCGLCFLVDWLSRLWSCPEHVDDHGRPLSLRPRLQYQLSFLGIIDLIAAMPLLCASQPNRAHTKPVDHCCLCALQNSLRRY